MRSILCALLLASAPVAAGAAEPPAVNAEAVETKETKAEPPFDPEALVAIFDKMFPAQPDPAPARLALSQATVQSLFPDGTYARMMDGVMGGLVDRIMDMSESDFGAKGKDGKPASKETLRQAAMKEDPHFEERMRIMERVVGEEMLKISRIIEPRLREGLARSIARRFDEKQLTEINGFLATETGKAFGAQSMAMWVDPEVMRSIMGSVPEVIEAMPAAMKRLEAETAHLPKPKKKVEAKAKAGEEPDDEQ